MSNQLQKEFDYYLAHQEELVKKYLNRVIVIKDQEVIGAYDDEIQAIAAAQTGGHQLGTFLVQRVERGQSGYTQTFHSRVTFS
ncbi:MAG: hypothetical protein ACRETA_11215 [Gammaproteobacteria bacterium]